MRIWFDTEFEENGTTIELISLGAVAENGSEFYAESSEFDWEIADPWLHTHVRPHLTGPAMSKQALADAFLNWVHAQTVRPQFWAYYGDYDWVVLCRLYGRMIDLPDTFPMFCLDLKQEMIRLGVEKSAIINHQEHNALSDAQWTKQTHLWLEGLDR
jgi:hypothetical protein